MNASAVIWMIQESKPASLENKSIRPAVAKCPGTGSIDHNGACQAKHTIKR